MGLEYIRLMRDKDETNGMEAHTSSRLGATEGLFSGPTPLLCLAFCRNTRNAGGFVVLTSSRQQRKSQTKSPSVEKGEPVGRDRGVTFDDMLCVRPTRTQ